MIVLKTQDIHEKLKTLKSWRFEKNMLRKDFVFQDFSQAFSFMTRVAFLAEKMDHHPDWSNVYNRVEISLNTHDAGPGVTEKDFRLAQGIDQLL